MNYAVNMQGFAKRKKAWLSKEADKLAAVQAHW